MISSSESFAARWGNPTFWALLVLAFGNVLRARDLRTFRPDSAAAAWTPHEPGHGRARLWEDPLGAGYAAFAELEQRAGAGGMAAAAKATLADFRSELEARLSPPGGGVDPHPLTLLLVHQRSGAFAEDREKRIRSRAAIVAALADAGLYAEDAERLSLVALAMQDGLAGAASGPPADRPGPVAVGALAVLPYEWFAGAQQDACVLWVDEHYLEAQPVARSIELLRRLQGEARLPGLRLRSIGPTDSGGLRAMLEEARGLAADPPWAELPEWQVLSPWSTAVLDPPAVPEAEQLWPRGRTSVSIGADRPLVFRRTIGFDDALLQALVRELEQRIPLLTLSGRWWERQPRTARAGGDDAGAPAPPGTSHGAGSASLEAPADERSPVVWPWRVLGGVLRGAGFLRVGDHRSVRIALIGEEDTVYARNFREAFAPRSTPSDSGQAIPWTIAAERVELCVVPYLRGIDGRTAPRAGAPAPASSSGLPVGYPAGHSQIDSLARLRDLLEREAAREPDARSPDQERAGFDAIGIVGSDVYDKLLILEALGPEFPDAVFFTTDIDARFCARVHLPYTRNLVVASHHGLEPSPADGVEGAPHRSFRDGYQTSQYLAVVEALALRPADDGSPASAVQVAPPAPRVFEIGTAGALELGAQPGRDWWRSGLLWGLVVSSLVLAVALLAFCPLGLAIWRFLAGIKRRERAAILGVALLTIGGAVYLRQSIEAQAAIGAGEPLAPFAGVSIWPSVVLRLAGAGFCLIAMLAVSARLRSLRAEIGTRHFGAVTRASEGKCSGGRRQRLSAARRTLRDLRPLPLREKVRRVGGLLSESCWLPFFFLASRAEADLAGRWNDFLRYDRSGQRLFRSVAGAIAFLAAMMPIFQSFPAPSSPARGAVALLADKGSAFVLVLCLLVLVFLVLDATQLGALFLREAADEVRTPIGADVEPGSDPERATEERRVRVLGEWHRRARIARDLTRVVQGLVYLPAIALCALVLSRLHWLDRFSWPASLFATFAILFLLLFVCAWNLSSAARAVRASALRRIEDERDALPTGSSARRAAAAMAEEVEGLEGGAFAPLPRHPLVRAALLPLAAFGSVPLIGQLSSF